MSVMERLNRMRLAMEAQGLDALVVSLPENVLLLSGFWPMIGASVLVFPLHGAPVCILPECYEGDAKQLFETVQTLRYPYGILEAPECLSAVKSLLQEASSGLSWKRIGYEGSFHTTAPSWNCAEFLLLPVNTPAFLQSVFPDSELIDASRLLQSERALKTSFEADKLRRASEISSFGLRAFEELVEVGISGVELAAAVEHAVMVQGSGFDDAVRVRAFAQVATGAKESASGYRPNEISTTRRLEDGEIALLELGVVADGYWADRTRVRVAGRPTPEQRKIFDIVREAQEAAISAIRPGVTGADVDEAARKVIRNAGYESLFPHVTGHGLGFRYHESIYLLSPSSEEVLEEGALVTVEPGIYSESVGGFRIEDDVLVTKTGSEILGVYPKTLC
ncbi:M24 family metallopeptidase [Paracidobacterium acidisoli]|uniref:Aminopeptidase P family protein n=1 Tax=Paracidobacterium acidisoli TaxID=2303751 RepID=A0A372ILG1_9BACT|nr:Xaa-Pro peptidase family protein [Paracidobacterium acidisoli]MBT9332381.1 Xaa-Pro peptidase family protein [Paracidobacterium acidisoli]